MAKTPMEQQYDSIKHQHQDKILLFRLGDFYEIFNDDAQIASNILNIAMTKRHERVMCGFPHHALEQYAYKLVEAGHKVAICEQTEDASQVKGLVKRDVVSILTKGTWTENPLMDRSINSFLAVVCYEEKELCCVFSDLSTGEVIIRSYSGENPLSFMIDELSRFRPVETLVAQNIFDSFPVEEEIKTYQSSLRILPLSYFQETALYKEYINTYNLNSTKAREKSLQGFFCYLVENHFTLEGTKHLKKPYEYEERDTLFMNEDTLYHLELIANTQDYTAKNTLFSVLNKTKTMPASRKLRRLLVAPSAQYHDIIKQLNRTDYFVGLTSLAGISDLLKGMGDLERLLSRLVTGKILPRECLALADAIQRAEKLQNYLSLAKPYQEYLSLLKDFGHIIQNILSKINPECSNSIDGDVFLKEVNAELDDLKEILRDSKNYLIKLQAEERLNTGISTLKISYNKIYGYYIEISKGAVKNIPDHYVRKQSLVNSERYTIPVLDTFEQKMSHAENSVITLERDLYEKLILELQKDYEDLIPLAEFVTEVDLRLSLAIVAKENRYNKPDISESFEWDIKEGRHPVVENLLKKESFVANNTKFNEQNRILVVTGPNMAGKSTFLRQNALFSIMTQIGSYLPAEKANIGIVDKIFTRIGASDDLSTGRSTFFVEMQEAAFILENVTTNSLVIMDELGRGTSTQDGLALAWAILEHFVFHPNKKAKVLFSTHYHELTELEKFDGIKNFCMAIQENQGKPIFLRKVVEGQAKKSYGVHVAEIAGMDIGVVKRAADILNLLEQGTFFKRKKITEQPSLFVQDDPFREKKEMLYQTLKKLDPNKLTPLDALREIFELINLLK